MAARDVIVAVVLLFVFGLGFFIMNFVGNTMVTSLVSNPQINASNASVEAIESIGTVVNRLDYVVMCLFIGLSLGMVITGWFIGGHSIFMFIYFIVVTFGVIISTVLSNVWETTTGMAVFGTTIASFPITNHIMTQLPYYAAVIGFIGLVAMFAKPYIAGGGHYE